MHPHINELLSANWWMIDWTKLLEIAQKDFPSAVGFVTQIVAKAEAMDWIGLALVITTLGPAQLDVLNQIIAILLKK